MARTLLTLKDDFVRTSDPPGTELTGRILSNTNVLKPQGEYRLTPSFSTAVNYSWTRVRFDDRAIGDLIDRDEHLIGASVFWKFVPKGDLFLNYSYGISNFTESSDRDFTSHNITVGLRGDITAKLSSGLYVGYTREEPVHGNQTSFNGLILVIGQGVMTEQGGGSGQFNGSVFLARTNSATAPYSQLASLGTPIIQWNGGGTNGIQYNSCWANIGNNMHFMIVASREEMY